MRRRIIICLGLLLALCLLGDAIGLYCLESSIERLTRLAESHRIQSMRSALNSMAIRIERDSLAHLIGHKQEGVDFSESIWRFKDSLRQCRSCHHNPRVEFELTKVQDTFEAWLDKTKVLYTDDGTDGTNPEKKEFIQLANRVVTITTEMVDKAHAHLITRSDEVAASVHQAWLTLCATLVAALIFGGMVAFHLQRRLTRPVSQLLDLIRRARTGEATDEIPISGDEEFRRLGDAFKQTYHELKSAQQGMLQAEKMTAVGKLAAGVAHEVGNPLASISSITQILRRKYCSEEDVKQFKLIMDHIRRISEIVRNMLTFSRPVKEEKRTLMDIRSLVDQAMELLAYDKRSKGIRITRDYPDELDAIAVDADRLLMVFTNIILNAFDVLQKLEPDTAELRISVRRKDDRLVLNFSDNGPGMNEYEIENAFEPFFTTKLPGEGTGLGLWICYETLHKHGGTVRIISPIEGGTTVTLEIPYEPNEP